VNRPAESARLTLEEELKLIPFVGWALAGLLLALLWTVVTPLLVATVPRRSDEPIWVLWIAIPIASVVVSIWLLMIFYVNADAKRRQMNRTLWTLLVIFIPNAIGFIIYFLLRQPIARPCPGCRAPVRPEHVFCPACGRELAAKCPGCRAQVQSGWSFCAACGARLG
jgi:hypothetical protein